MPKWALSSIPDHYLLHDKNDSTQKKLIAAEKFASHKFKTTQDKVRFVSKVQEKLEAESPDMKPQDNELEPSDGLSLKLHKP